MKPNLLALILSSQQIHCKNTLFHDKFIYHIEMSHLTSCAITYSQT